MAESSGSVSSIINEKEAPTTVAASVTSRRNILQKSILTTGFSLLLTSFGGAEEAHALELCRPKSRNCIRTIWTAPSSTNKEEAIKILKEVVGSYPQNGQNGIDCNGWSIVEDTLSSESGIRTLKLEFKSCVGPAAVTMNLAQPFIDDVKLEVVQGKGKNDGDDDNLVYVEVKSSSRMGASDLFVNKRRIEFLGIQLREKGWAVPDVKYGQ